MRSAGRRALSFAAMLLPAACAEDLGPLDRGVLLDLADDVGDAVGASLSATWTFSPTALSCECARNDLTGLDDVAVCTLVSSPLVGVSRLFIVQADGFVSVRAGELQLTGPVRADATLAAATVASFRLLDQRSLLLVRWDAGVSEGATRLEGLWSQRGVIDLGSESADCTASYRVLAERL